MTKARKPLEANKKHFTKAEIAEREDGENSIIIGNDQLQKPPEWLVDDIAVNEWNRIVNETNKISIIGNLDLNNLGGYCNAYSFYRKTTEELSKKPLLVNKLSGGSIVKTKNPLIDVQLGYAAEIRKFAALCGMTVDSRLKASVIKTNNTQENITDEFGDI